MYEADEPQDTFVSGTQTQPYGDDERNELLKYRFDTDSVIRDIENQLRGRVFDFNLNKQVITGEPILNNEGINWVVTQIRSKVNSVVIQSNLSDEEVNRVCGEFRKMVVKMIFIKQKEWKVDSERLFSSDIIYLIDHFTFLSLKRAWHDKEREHTSPVLKYDEHHMIGGEKKSFKLFGGK